MAQQGTELHDAVAPRGVVVPPENVATLAEAIEMLVEDPALRAHFGAEGAAVCAGAVITGGGVCAA